MSDDTSAGQGPLPEYDWSSADHVDSFRRWRTRGLAAAMALVVAAAVADDVGRLDVGLTRLEWLTALAGVVAGAYLVVPLVADRDLARQYWAALRDDPLALGSLGYLLAVFVAGVLGPLVVGHPEAILVNGFQPPVFTTASTYVVPDCVGQVSGTTCHGSFRYPLGTNGQGQDMVFIVLLGARVATQVALVTGAILVPVGVAVGLVAGYRGGLVDEVLMRLVDIQGAVPAFLVYLVLSFVYGRSLFLLVVVFGLLSWGKVARLVRSEVLQRRDENFVLATRSAGASELYVIRNTILPNVSGTVITAATRQASTLVLLEAALAYMELSEGGIGSWGEAISFGMNVNFLANWWMSLWPVVALTLTVVALNAFGDAMRDVLDPTTEREDGQ